MKYGLFMNKPLKLTTKWNTITKTIATCAALKDQQRYDVLNGTNSATP